MQAQLQLANAGLAGAQPAEQCGILGLVVDSVGGQAQAYRHTGSLINSGDRKSTRLNSSHLVISYAVFCLKKKTILVKINQIGSLTETMEAVETARMAAYGLVLSHR